MCDIIKKYFRDAELMREKQRKKEEQGGQDNQKQAVH